MPQPSVSDVHVNGPLTNFSIAYVQAAGNYIADQVFPNVPVVKQSDVYFKYDKGDWLRPDVALRAPATESTGGGWKLSTDSYRCDLYATHKDLDNQTLSNQDNPLNMDRDAAIWVTQQLMLKRDQLWVSEFFTSTGVWGSDTVGGTGAGNGTTTFQQWDVSGSDPIGDITNRTVYMASQTGFRPNTLVIDPYTFNTLRNHDDLLDRIKYTQGPAIVTEALLAQLFGVDRVLVAWSMANTAGEGITDSFSFNAGTNALLCYTNTAPSIMQPSAGYTFVWSGLLGGGAGAPAISRWWMQEIKSFRVEGEMGFDHKVVSTDCGYFFKDTLST